jgi:hypothetical protein
MTNIDIIEEEERVEGTILPVDWDPGTEGLCDGDTCRHSECECWDRFRLAVRRAIKDSIIDTFRVEAMIDALGHAPMKCPVYIKFGAELYYFGCGQGSGGYYGGYNCKSDHK